MGRLIDADAFLKELEETATAVENARSGETIKKAFLQCLATVREGIIRTPTAYDVEKVVAELEKLPIYEFGVTLLNTEEYVKLSDLKQAIDIVKRGGVE